SCRTDFTETKTKRKERHFSCRRLCLIYANLCPLLCSQRVRRALVNSYMRQLIVILTALAVVAPQTPAGILDWLFDPVNKDEIARREAQFLVMDGAPHPSSARFEKVNIVEKDGPFYLFHVVLSTSRGGLTRNRKSYLVCFKLTEHATEFRILTVIQDAS